jgi:hypothetical protein
MCHKFLLLLLHVIGSINAAIFQDDLGVTHEWDNIFKAKVAVRAGIWWYFVVSYGVCHSDPLVATWGLWGHPWIQKSHRPVPSFRKSIRVWTKPPFWRRRSICHRPVGRESAGFCFQFDNVTDLVALQDQFF